MPDEHEQGMNRALIGKVYRGDPAIVVPEEIYAFAEATQDSNPMYRLGSDTVVAPPLFPVKYCNRIYFAIFKDQELRVDFPRLLFGEMEMRFFRLLRPGERVDTTARIGDIEDKESGQLLTVVTTVECEGENLCEAKAGFFVRSLAPRPKAQRTKETRGEELPVVFEDATPIREDQPNLFAKAADDPNPIHIDDEFARSVGLPGRILHGLCTMAFASKAFVQHACGNDPTRLRRLKVRFSRPALPGQTVITRAFEPVVSGQRKIYRFVALTAPDTPVITQGEAEVDVL